MSRARWRSAIPASPAGSPPTRPCSTRRCLSAAPSSSSCWAAPSAAGPRPPPRRASASAPSARSEALPGGCGAAGSTSIRLEPTAGSRGEAIMSEGALIKIGGLEIRYVVDGVETGAASGMFELTVHPGAKVPPAHSHRDNEEIVYVLEGVLRYAVDDDRRDL